MNCLPEDQKNLIMTADPADRFRLPPQFHELRDRCVANGLAEPDDGGRFRLTEYGRLLWQDLHEGGG